MKKERLNVLDTKQLIKEIGYEPHRYYVGPAFLEKYITILGEFLKKFGATLLFRRAFAIHDWRFAHNTGLWSRFVANLEMRKNMNILLDWECEHNAKVKRHRKDFEKRIKGAFWVCMLGMFFYDKKSPVKPSEKRDIDSVKSQIEDDYMLELEARITNVKGGEYCTLKEMEETLFGKKE